MDLVIFLEKCRGSDWVGYCYLGYFNLVLNEDLKSDWSSRLNCDCVSVCQTVTSVCLNVDWILDLRFSVVAYSYSYSLHILFVV